MNDQAAPSAQQSELDDFLARHPDVAVIDAFVSDLSGILRGKRLSRADAKKLYGEGLLLPGTTFLLDVTGGSCDPGGRGFSDGDPDHVLKPVPGALAPIPWASRPSGQVLMTTFEPDGSRFVADPRHVLAGVVERFAKDGLTPVVAVELEFYLIDAQRAADGMPQVPIMPRTGRRADSLQVYGIAELDDFAELFAEVAAFCAAQNIPAAAASAEFAPSQYEINLVHTDDPLAAADHGVLLQRVIKATAKRHGVEATFISKPFVDRSGSGLHFHVSPLDEAGGNIFQDGEAPEGSAALRHAVGGMAATMSEAMAIFAPNVNGYRRLAPRAYAPHAPTWGVNNRTVAMRIPGGSGANRRIEHRVAGADANIYLALASVLAGIHHGIENALEPGPPITGSAYERVPPALPPTWRDALDAFKAAKILPRYFGEEYCLLYHAVKQGEMAAYLARPTALEYAWYLRTD